MLLRLFVFLIGFGLSIIGSFYLIIYLNLLSYGYNFTEYVKFISSRFECLNFVFGIIFMLFSIFFMGGKNNELCL